MKLVLFVILFALSAFAAEVADSTSNGADSAAVFPDHQKNIPLPRQSAYTGAGLSFGLGAGVYDPTDECDCVGIWQVQMEYFYTPGISAGLDVRYLGGDLDSDVMIMYQRYRLNLRIHQAWEKLDLYAEPVFGFENTSISEFRRQVKEHDSGKRSLEGSSSDASVDSVDAELREDDCEKIFSLDGFSLGIGMGGGYVLSKYLGATGSVLVEYNFSRAVQVSLTPGLAFNLQSVWTWGREKLRSTWLSVEFGAQRYFNRGVSDWAVYGFLGFQAGI